MPWPWSASVVMDDGHDHRPAAEARHESRLRAPFGRHADRLSAGGRWVNSAHLTFARRQPIDGGPQWSHVLGQAPTRTPDRPWTRAAALPSRPAAPVVAAASVLLNATRFSRDGSLRPAPTAGRARYSARHRERRREANLLERGDRFGPAADQREPSQAPSPPASFGQRVAQQAAITSACRHRSARISASQSPARSVSPNASASRWSVSGTSRHGRRWDRLAAIVADQFSPSPPTAALELTTRSRSTPLRHGTCLEVQAHTRSSMSAPVTRTG